MATETITFEHSAHGRFEVTAEAFDWAVAHYAHRSITTLHIWAGEIAGFDYRDVASHFGMMIVLASMCAPDPVDVTD